MAKSANSDPGPGEEMRRECLYETVKAHVAAILRRLGLRDRPPAVIYGYEHDLVRPRGGPHALADSRSDPRRR